MHFNTEAYFDQIEGYSPYAIKESHDWRVTDGSILILQVGVEPDATNL